jgi:hypothetical protein
MSAIAASLLLASAALSKADRLALDAATAALYAPYSREEISPAVWERDIWSGEVRKLIARWQAVIPENEPDAMNDGDWLCQCQDWDAKAFHVTITQRKKVSKNVAEVALDIVLFADAEPRDAFLTFRHENGRWLLDEMFTKEYADGIKAALVQTIVEDISLREARP